MMAWRPTVMSPLDFVSGCGGTSRNCTPAPATMSSGSFSGLANQPIYRHAQAFAEVCPATGHGMSQIIPGKLAHVLKHARAMPTDDLDTGKRSQSNTELGHPAINKAVSKTHKFQARNSDELRVTKTSNAQRPRSNIQFPLFLASRFDSFRSSQNFASYSCDAGSAHPDDAAVSTAAEKYSGGHTAAFSAWRFLRTVFRGC